MSIRMPDMEPVLLSVVWCMGVTISCVRNDAHVAEPSGVLFASSFPPSRPLEIGSTPNLPSEGGIASPPCSRHSSAATHHPCDVRRFQPEPVSQARENRVSMIGGPSQSDRRRAPDHGTRPNGRRHGVEPVAVWWPSPSMRWPFRSLVTQIDERSNRPGSVWGVRVRRSTARCRCGQADRGGCTCLPGRPSFHR
jgi:hypothetical protein